MLDVGQALRVSTGAHIPPATTMVVPQEHAVVEDGIVVGMVAQSERNHIRPPGDEARSGERVLTAGRRVTPAVAAIAASCGYDEIEVYARPVVNVIVTGDELSDRGPSKPGTIRDSLSMQLPAWIEWSGGQVGSITRIHDSLGELLRTMDAARGHMLVITGGSAHGPRDFGRPALSELGAELIVDEVDCKPGHPTVLAGLPDGRVVANIPGNPLAACVAFMTVVDPALTALAGGPLRELRPAALNEPMTSTTTRVVPVTVEHGVATPTGFARPAMLRGLAAADAFAVVPPADEPTFECGLLPLPWQS
jgi:molybdopterin molybdotransferase